AGAGIEGGGVVVGAWLVVFGPLAFEPRHRLAQTLPQGQLQPAPPRFLVRFALELAQPAKVVAVGIRYPRPVHASRQPKSRTQPASLAGAGSDRGDRDADRPARPRPGCRNVAAGGPPAGRTCRRPGPRAVGGPRSSYRDPPPPSCDASGGKRGC